MRKAFGPLVPLVRVLAPVRSFLTIVGVRWIRVIGFARLHVQEFRLAAKRYRQNALLSGLRNIDQHVLVVLWFVKLHLGFFEVIRSDGNRV